MVGLERLEDLVEIEEVRQLIRRYVEYTGSGHAARLLNGWEEAVPPIRPHHPARLQADAVGDPAE